MGSGLRRARFTHGSEASQWCLEAAGEITPETARGSRFIDRLYRRRPSRVLPARWVGTPRAGRGRCGWGRSRRAGPSRTDACAAPDAAGRRRRSHRAGAGPGRGSWNQGDLLDGHSASVARLGGGGHGHIVARATAECPVQPGQVSAQHRSWLQLSETEFFRAAEFSFPLKNFPD